VIALGFQGIVVFDFPPTASGLDDLQHVTVIERQGRRKGVMIQWVTAFIGGREFTPVDPQGVIPIP
jgi:hypothetical protein